jgi:hypothetical protein
MNPFLEEWAPKVGVRAAKAQYLATRLVGLAGLVGIPDVVAFGLAMNSPSDTFRVLTSVLLGVVVALFIVGCMYMRASFQAMSSHFGMRVWLLNSPTFRAGNFEKWKARNGLS